MPSTSFPSSDAGSTALGIIIFFITGLLQIWFARVQARRYEERTGKPLPAEQRAEVRLQVIVAAAPLILLMEGLLDLLLSPIGWLTVMGIGLISILVPVRIARARERRWGAFSREQWLVVALSLWPAYLYLAVALFSWPISQLLPDQAAHTTAPGVFYFFAWFFAFALVLLFSPVGWVLFVAGGLAILIRTVRATRRAGKVRLSRRVALLWNGWRGLALIAVALFFWPFSAMQPASSPTTNATNTNTDATATPLATGTVSPVIRGAVLGAPQDAFDAAFGPGQPPFVQAPQPMLIYHISGAPIELTVSFLPGRDLVNRVAGISARQPITTVGTPMAWDESAALAFAEKLLPPDAKSQGTVRTDQGTVLLYSSAALASAFDPRFFQNADGSAAQPGTLQLRCQSPNASTLALGQCIVSLGGV